MQLYAVLFFNTEVTRLQPDDMKSKNISVAEDHDYHYSCDCKLDCDCVGCIVKQNKSLELALKLKAVTLKSYYCKKESCKIK